MVAIGGRFFLPRGSAHVVQNKNESNIEPKPSTTPTPAVERDQEPTPEPVVSMLEDTEAISPEPEATEQEPEVLEIPDEGASGRLAMLRRELDGEGNAPRPSLEERMSRFFDD